MATNININNRGVIGRKRKRKRNNRAPKTGPGVNTNTGMDVRVNNLKALTQMDIRVVGLLDHVKSVMRFRPPISTALKENDTMVITVGGANYIDFSAASLYVKVKFKKLSGETFDSEGDTMFLHHGALSLISRMRIFQEEKEIQDITNFPEVMYHLNIGSLPKGYEDEEADFLPFNVVYYYNDDGGHMERLHYNAYKDNLKQRPRYSTAVFNEGIWLRIPIKSFLEQAGMIPIFNLAEGIRFEFTLNNNLAIGAWVEGRTSETADDGWNPQPISYEVVNSYLYVHGINGAANSVLTKTPFKWKAEDIRVVTTACNSQTTISRTLDLRKSQLTKALTYYRYPKEKLFSNQEKRTFWSTNDGSLIDFLNMSHLYSFGYKWPETTDTSQVFGTGFESYVFDINGRKYPYPEQVWGTTYDNTGGYEQEFEKTRPCEAWREYMKFFDYQNFNLKSRNTAITKWGGYMVSRLMLLPNYTGTEEPVDGDGNQRYAKMKVTPIAGIFNTLPSNNKVIAGISSLEVSPQLTINNVQYWEKGSAPIGAQEIIKPGAEGVIDTIISYARVYFIRNGAIEWED